MKYMKPHAFLVFCATAIVGVPCSQAATLAYFQDGTGVDSAGLTNIAPPDAAYAVSVLDAVGFSANASEITRSEFALGTGGPAPAGPTAGSDVGSEWFFARSTTTQVNPGTGNDYYGFTVTANGGNTLSLQSLKYDFVSVLNAGDSTTSITASAEAFLSVDGGSFSSIGAVTAFDDKVAAGFGVVQSANFDLSSIAGATSIEIRIGIGDDVSTNSAASFLQGIELSGSAIPEPSSYALIGGLVVSAFAMIRRRR
ncbi:PEP-CTERM sorting domain-containing protein [Coraliomargarita sp. W4R72]